jgi:hypothetical protein
MANVISVNVYNINGDNQANSVTLAFPATGCLLRDTISSPTRSLSTGYNVYSAVQYNNALYYCRETIAQLVTLFG